MPALAMLITYPVDLPPKPQFSIVNGVLLEMVSRECFMAVGLVGFSCGCDCYFAYVYFGFARAIGAGSVYHCISYHFEVEGIVCHIGAVEINEFCSGVKEEVCGFTVDFGFQVYVVTEVFYVVFPAVGVQGCEEER